MAQLEASANISRIVTAPPLLRSISAAFSGRGRLCL